MLSVIYAECRKKAHYAECHYAECRYAECRGALVNEAETKMRFFGWDQNRNKIQTFLDRGGGGRPGPHGPP